MSTAFLQRAVPGVQGLKPYQPGKPVAELEREYGVSNIIKLASNENPLGPGAKAMEVISRALPELARYPDGNGFDLKMALAKRGCPANARSGREPGRSWKMRSRTRRLLRGSSMAVSKAVSR